jgi:hypothetical protein
MTTRTRVARAVFWLSGKLTRIKTPQRFYRIISINEDAVGDEPFMVTRRTKRRWHSCRTSTRLMSLSLRIDPLHWDHWALVHDTCAGERCSCGGNVCTWICDEENLNEAA